MKNRFNLLILVLFFLKAYGYRPLGSKCNMQAVAGYDAPCGSLRPVQGICMTKEGLEIPVVPLGSLKNLNDPNKVCPEATKKYGTWSGAWSNYCYCPDEEPYN